MEQFTSVQKKDLKVLVNFIRVYCESRHGGTDVAPCEELTVILGNVVHLCPDCRTLLGYALQKRRNCPLDPKPSCKNCRIHCYNKEYRAKICEIMAFSGKKMIMRGRLDYLWHYFF